MPAKKKKNKQQSKIRDMKPTKDAKGGIIAIGPTKIHGVTGPRSNLPYKV